MVSAPPSTDHATFPCWDDPNRTSRIAVPLPSMVMVSVVTPESLAQAIFDAGGLSEGRQLEILEVLAGHLEHTDAGRRRGDPVQGSYDDMVRLAAALEQVPVMHRIEVGKWLLERLQRPAEKPHTWWALGRVGARESLYGSAHHVVPPEIAADWLGAVLALDWKRIEPAAFAAAQIARLTGDRSRDLAPELRDEVARRLIAARAPQSWVTMVREIASLDEADRRRSFGESLPPGLKLITAAPDRSPTRAH